MNLLTDLTSTAQRKMSLNRYFSQHVLTNQEFICPFFKECRESHDGIFYEGQLHHIGSHYDMFTSGNPFRIMVVGQEYGHGPSHVSMEDRFHMVVEETGLKKSFSNRNPHMRGTTSVLRMLFGIPLGSDHSDEFLQFPNEGRIHIFDAFSLVNFLLCSATKETEGRHGNSSLIMRRNCLVHFKKALEILEPTVVIVQGKTFWSSIQNGFSNLKMITDTFYTAEINKLKVMIAVFTHPSTPDKAHNWGRDAKTPYLLKTVLPTISLIHQKSMDDSIPNGEFPMPPISNYPTQPCHSQFEKPNYDEIFEQIKTGLVERFPPKVIFRHPRFEHSTPNRMRIYLDRITGSHYQITFMRERFEFALHFESTPNKSLERRQAFDPHLRKLTEQVGTVVKSGSIENNGWMGVWFERKVERINSEQINMYIDQFSRFISATYPILEKLYDRYA